MTSTGLLAVFFAALSLLHTVAASDLDCAVGEGFACTEAEIEAAEDLMAEETRMELLQVKEAKVRGPRGPYADRYADYENKTWVGLLESVPSWCWGVPASWWNQIADCASWGGCICADWCWTADPRYWYTYAGCCGCVGAPGSANPNRPRNPPPANPNRPVNPPQANPSAPVNPPQANPNTPVNPPPAAPPVQSAPDQTPAAPADVAPVATVPAPAADPDETAQDEAEAPTDAEDVDKSSTPVDDGAAPVTTADAASTATAAVAPAAAAPVGGAGVPADATPAPNVPEWCHNVPSYEWSSVPACAAEGGCTCQNWCQQTDMGSWKWYSNCCGCIPPAAVPAAVPASVPAVASTPAR